MSQLKFTRGDFQSFRATTKIHMGKYSVDIDSQALFLYDGHTVRYNGTEYDVPQLRGLVGSWFVPEQDLTTQYQSQPAGVQVSPATPESKGQSFSMGRASEEEAVVGTMSEATQVRTAAASGDTDRLTQLREARRAQAAERQGVEGYQSSQESPTKQVYQKAEATTANPGPKVQVSESELQQVAEANRINQEKIAQAALALSQRDPFKTREQMGGQRHDALDAPAKASGKFAVVRDEQDDGIPVGNYQFSDGATVGNPEDARNRASSRPTDVMRTAATQPVQVGRAVALARNSGAQVVADPTTTHIPQAAGAVNTTQISGQGNVSLAENASGTTGDVVTARSSDDLSELLPDAAVAGRVTPPPAKMTEEEEVQAIAEAWCVKRQWKKRVGEAVDFYADWPAALEAIYAVETPAVVKQIKGRLAKR